MVAKKVHKTVKFTPRPVLRQIGVECEKHCDPAAELCELITIGPCDFCDDPFALEPAQIVGRPPTGVGRLEKSFNALDSCRLVKPPIR